MKSRRGTLALTFALLALAVAFVVWRFPRERLLLDHAVRTADAKDFTEFRWLSSHDLLYHTAWAHGHASELRRLDITTGQSTPLTELNRRIENGVTKWEVSPDARHLVWTDSENHHVQTADLDGSHFANWLDSKKHQIEAHWTPDSRQLVAFQDTETDAKGNERYVSGTRRAPEDSHGGQPLPLPKQYRDEFKTESSYYFTPQGNLLVDSTECTCHATELVLSEYTLQTPLKQIRHLVVDRPYSGHIITHRLSPHADKIAWSVQHEYTTPFAKFLRYYFPKLKDSTKTVVGVYVSNLDGTNMTELGHVPVPKITAKSDPNEDGEPGTVAWLPDGKTLSFLYKKALYTIPVD